MSNDIRARYQQAQQLVQGDYTKRVVRNLAVLPHWIGDSDCFWYIRENAIGKDFRLVDAGAGTNVPAFDHHALAKVLGDAAGETVDAADLPLKLLTMSLPRLTIRFQAFGKRWLFEPDSNRCQELEGTEREMGFLKAQPVYEGSQRALGSPDGKSEVFARDHNLWVRDRATGKERALTQDGKEDYSYGRAGSWGLDFEVQARWSPDSKRLLAVVLDLREVTARPTIHYVPRDGSLRPQLTHAKMAFPGDPQVEAYRVVAIDVETGSVKPADYPSLPFMLYGEQVLGFISAGLAWWSSDSGRAYFVDVARGSKAVRVVSLDPKTGKTRQLFEETSSTFVKLRHSHQDLPQIVPLPETDELIWFSERSGWAHIYLYDLKTAQLKNPITKGDWLVRNVLGFDPGRRELLLQTAGRDAAIHPYYRDVCKVNIDTGELTTLATGPFEHVLFEPHSMRVLGQSMAAGESADVHGVSPSRNFLVTTRSRVDTVPESILIDREGQVVMTVEAADASGLPKGWTWPEPVKLKGADGETDIYGVVYRPPGFSPDRKYPVVDFCTSMRNYSTLPQGSFIHDSIEGMSYLPVAAIAALGFVVVIIDGRGTALRNKAFSDHHYGDPAYTSDLDDRIAGIRQLAKRYPYMDLDRVGLTGWESMGSNSVYALLRHPEFYKVAVVNCFTDPRMNVAALAETYDGISTDNLAELGALAAETQVGKLEGKLLLIQGLLAALSPGTFRLVEALQKANKDFEMLSLPNLSQQMTGYTNRREWDFLVRHLQGIEPPREFKLTTGFELASGGN